MLHSEQEITGWRVKEEDEVDENHSIPLGEASSKDEAMEQARKQFQERHPHCGELQVDDFKYNSWIRGEHVDSKQIVVEPIVERKNLKLTGLTDAQYDVLAAAQNMIDEKHCINDDYAHLELEKNPADMIDLKRTVITIENEQALNILCGTLGYMADMSTRSIQSPEESDYDRNENLKNGGTMVACGTILKKLDTGYGSDVAPWDVAQLASLTPSEAVESVLELWDERRNGKRQNNRSLI